MVKRQIKKTIGASTTDWILNGDVPQEATLWG